jgi:5-methylcytosine-specific restriction endonuclease McrA
VELNSTLGINNIMKCLTCQSDLLKRDQKKFCSRSCAATFNNTGRRRHSKPESKYSIVKSCFTCGKPSGHRKYCSDVCNPKRLSLTPEEKIARHKAIHNEAWHRYMAKRKNQTPAGVDIKALQQFYLNCPEGYEVDHIIPISKGGLHTLENLQYLTVSENRKKSNKIL